MTINFNFIPLGCSLGWSGCSRDCCWKSFKCRDCKKKFYLLCGAYLYPPKKGKRMLTVSRPTSDQSDWMEKHKSKRLKNIIMPGSHHSGFQLILYDYLSVFTFFEFVTSI